MKKLRRNGFSCPLNLLQVLSWVAALFKIAFFYILSINTLEDRIMRVKIHHITVLAHIQDNEYHVLWVYNFFRNSYNLCKPS